MAKLRKKNKNRFYGFILVLTLLLLCGLAALGYFVFEIKEIKVEGSQRFSQEEVIAQSGVQVGQNLFLVSKKQLKANLEAQPYLQFSHVSYDLPSTLIIHVTEKTAYGAIPFDGQYAFVDEAGKVLQLSDEANSVPVVQGMGATAAVEGEMIQGPSSYQMHVFGTLMPKLFAQSYADRIVEVDLTQPAAIHVKLDTGMTLRLGTIDNVDAKLGWVETLMPRLTEEGKITGTLDVTGENGASYIP